MNSFFEKLRAKLIDDAGKFWHYWSIKISALIALLSWYLLQFPAVAYDVMNMMPPEIRQLVPTFWVAAMFGALVISRLVKQKPPTP